MYRNRIARLLILLGLMGTLPIVSSCKNFTLVGSIDLGNGDSVPNEGPDYQPNDQNNEVVCWPPAKEAAAEMRSHGYTPKAWPKTAAWFRRLETVKASVPACE